MKSGDNKRLQTMHQRNKQRLQLLIETSGKSVTRRETRLALAFLQALDTIDLLWLSSAKKTDLASAVLFRFGLDTVANGFWIASVATDEWLNGEGEQRMPNELSATIKDLPPEAQKLLQEVIDRPINNDPSTSFLKDVLNPATHGDSLVSAMRVHSAETAGWNWSFYLYKMMYALTWNFAVLVNQYIGINLLILAGIVESSATEVPRQVTVHEITRCKFDRD